MFDMVLLKFLTQRAAVDAETGCSFGLVVVAVPQHGLEHGLFDFRDHGIEQVTGQFAVEVVQILANSLFDRLLQLTGIFLFRHSHLTMLRHRLSS